MGTARHVALALRGLTLVAAAAVLACEPRAHRVAPRDSAAATTASDTVVRQVIRFVRRASAMQRATGMVRPLRALEPLDSILAIRVFDQRGAELSGVPVRWTLANAAGGAEIRPINTTTDSLGLSRVAFTPGRSASGQGPVAEVRGVGRIDFAITVQPSSIQVVADRTTFWSGEDEIVSAVLTDDAGNELPGGSLAWVTSDTSVLRVQSVDSLHARVTGLYAGSATLFGWIGTARGSTRLTVKPVVSGRFVTIDGGSIPEMKMEVGSGSSSDAVSVERGQFVKRVELPPEADVDIRATALSDASSFHPVRLRLRSQRELRDLRIVLVPRSWRVDAGEYQGQTLGIDAVRAMTPSSTGAPFWRLAPISGRGLRTLLGWRESDLPLRVAFDRRRSSERIDAADSIAFWTTVAQMQRDLGAALFVPADMSSDTGYTNFARIEISGQVAEGHTFVSWTQSGDINDGAIQFRHAATLREPGVVTHELLHLLGFGHSTAWPTISRPTGGREARLTPEDVAYVQLAMRLRHLQQQTGARPGLPIAQQ
jgi:hypothetical protein